MTRAQRQMVTRRMTERKKEEKEGQLERHKWWQTEETLYTHTHTHTHMRTHTHTQMRWVSNQTEAGRTAVGENEFCSLEARRERKKREERKEKRKEGRSE